MIILFADNDPDFLITRSQFLEAAGYQVLPAGSLEQARSLLGSVHLHLAILDIRLIEDDDEKDVSGLTLAKDGDFARIPKIILTGKPAYQYVREALRPTTEGITPAVDFLSKEDPVDAMLAAVEKACSQHVRINVKLALRWDERQPISLIGLLGLIDPHLLAGSLPERRSELADLFGQLFYDYAQVSFTRCLWRTGRQVALAAFACTPEGKEDAFIVTVGPLENGHPRAQLAEKTAVEAAEASGVDLKAAAGLVHYAAQAWSLPGEKLEELQSLAEAYCEKPERLLRLAVENLFQTMLKAWREPHVMQEDSHLAQLYRQRFGLSEERFPPASLQVQIQGLLSEGLNRRLADLSQGADQLTLHWPDGREEVLPDPTGFIYEDDRLPAARALCATAVDLDVDTVLVNRAGRSWPTLFANLGQGPIWLEYILLEASIRFDLLDSGDLRSLVEMERAFLSADYLDAPVSLDDVAPEHRRAAGLIQLIRRLAAEHAGREIEPYELGLFFCALRRLVDYDPAVRETGPALARRLYALVLAAMLCKRMEERSLTPTGDEAAPKILRLDEQVHQVWVGDRQVELTNTEFKLLKYLYDHRQELCKRSDIMREVFKIEKPSKDDEDSLLNTNMLRLRRKIEPYPNRPTYIITQRGIGYRLHLGGQPEE